MVRAVARSGRYRGTQQGLFLWRASGGPGSVKCESRQAARKAGLCWYVWDLQLYQQERSAVQSLQGEGRERERGGKQGSVSCRDGGKTGKVSR